MKPDRQVDRLYALPLAEFIAARNELAKALRAKGDRAGAEEIKMLAKPSVAAWAVNQLFFTDNERFEQLLAAAKAQRRALARGTTSRSADERKREAMAGLLRRAEGVLRKAGSQWTPALRQRVHRTLESLAAAPPGSNLRPGRLTVDLQPAGFDALAGAAIAPPPGRPHRKKARAKRPSATSSRRRKALDQKIRALEADLTEARKKRASSARALTRVKRRASDARKAAQAAQRRAERARERADDLDLRLRRARADLDNTSSSVARIEARLESEKSKRRT